MKEFMMIFRNDHRPDISASPEQMQEIMKSWMDWIGYLAASDQLVSRGNRLGTEGKTIKPNNVVTDGPYVEIKEAVGGYIIVKAMTIEEATELAKSCPILRVGGSVEVRDVIDMKS